MNITFIGAGNMGSALCRGMKDALDIQISIADRNTEKLEAFSDIPTSTNPSEILQDADCVFIAVKPQAFQEFCDNLEVTLENKLIVSIMAGITIESISKATGSNRIVRSMPNLGVQVGKGVTGWTASTDVSDIDKQFVSTLFSASGMSIEIEESSMDKFSTIAGCGPAYFYTLCSILKHEAVALGIAESDAEQIAMQTFLGSALYMNEHDKTSEELVSAVASKGGVTQAALDSLAESGIQDIFAEALKKAEERSKELGG